MKTYDPPISYDTPASELLPYYLVRLEQLLAVRCGNTNAAKSDFLSGTRSIVDGNIDLCLNLPHNVTTRILLAETLASLTSVKPGLLGEFEEKIQALQTRHPLPAPAQQVVQRIFDKAFAS